MNKFMPALATITALLLAACGVPAEPKAQPLPSGISLPSPSPTPTPTPSPSPSPSELSQVVDLWFVRDDGLAVVEREVPVSLTPENVIEQLAILPVISADLRTVVLDPVTGDLMVNEFTATPEIPNVADVTVSVTGAFGVLPPTEQVLLLGQVVLSMAGSGWESVAFVDPQGTPLAVPLPDGRVIDRPATAGDYARLIVAL